MNDVKRNLSAIFGNRELAHDFRVIELNGRSLIQSRARGLADGGVVAVPGRRIEIGFYLKQDAMIEGSVLIHGENRRQRWRGQTIPGSVEYAYARWAAGHIHHVDLFAGGKKVLDGGTIALGANP